MTSTTYVKIKIIKIDFLKEKLYFIFLYLTLKWPCQ